MGEDPRGLILAIDPGREKCGLALVTWAGETVSKAVVPRGEIVAQVRLSLTGRSVGPIVVGDRTGSKAFRAELAALGLPSSEHPLVVVDEHLSSQEARLRYLEDHPGRGIARFLPLSLRSPDKPIDDYVAVILAERYLAQMAQRA